MSKRPAGKGEAMLTHVDVVTLYVADQAAMATFFTD